MNTIIALAFFCSIVPAVLWVWNMVLYREPASGSCAETGTCVLPDSSRCSSPLAMKNA